MPQISSSDKAAMQERFCQEQCTDRRTIQRLVATYRETGKCSRYPTKATMVNIVQIVQIQQARIILNPLTDIFTKCFSFSFILISLPLQDINLWGKSLRPSWRILKTDVLEMQVSCERRRVDFLGKSSWRSCKFWIFSGIMPNDKRSRSLWVSVTLLVFRNLSFHQIHCSCQNLSCIANCQKNWFCGKVRLDDFIGCCLV